SLEDKEASGKIQRELQREANEYIDSQTEHLDTKEFAAWLGGKINSKRGASEYKRNNGIKAPERKVVPNTFKDRNPHSLKNKSWKQQQRDTSTGKVSNSANFGGSSGWTGGKTQQEVERNLVSITSPSGAKFKVNKTVAGNFASFIEELEDVVGYPINAESSAGYHWRKKRGKSSLSQHSYGNAIDINWNENKAFWGGEDVISKIPNIDDIAAKHGLVWGGSWKNKDTMQFEYHPSTGVPAKEV
ncbi:MAG: M15 family metallopeptidase, partial [Candidatus Thorarchaeota archaeon]